MHQSHLKYERNGYLSHETEARNRGTKKRDGSPSHTATPQQTVLLLKTTPFFSCVFYYVAVYYVAVYRVAAYHS